MHLLGQVVGNTAVAPLTSRSSAQTRGRSIEWNMLWASVQAPAATLRASSYPPLSLAASESVAKTNLPQKLSYNTHIPSQS